MSYRKRRERKEVLRHKYKGTGSIKIYRSERRIDLLGPAKFQNIVMPLFPLLPVSTHAYLSPTPYISYGSQSKMVNLTYKEFSAYQGPLYLSIAQQEIHPKSIPLLVSQNFRSIYKVNLWYYRGRRVTNWHYDAHDNFLYVLRGTKTVYLRKPDSMPCQNVFSDNSNQAIKQKTRPHQRIVLKKGECLFIPCGWFHKVYSSGDQVVAVNFWGNSISEIDPQLHQTYLKYLVSAAAQKTLKRLIQTQLQKFPALKKRSEDIMEADIQGLRLLGVHTPLDFEILASKLQKGLDQSMESVWTFVNYQQFRKARIHSRSLAFSQYLTTIT